MRTAPPTLPEPLSMDLVKQLRAQHQHAEAQELLKAFRKSCEKQLAQDRRELERIARAKRTCKGVCHYYGCQEPSNGYKYCVTHRERARGYYRARKERLAKRSVAHG